MTHEREVAVQRNEYISSHRGLSISDSDLGAMFDLNQLREQIALLEAIAEPVSAKVSRVIYPDRRDLDQDFRTLGALISAEFRQEHPVRDTLAAYEAEEVARREMAAAA